ncbi:DUF6456 domain-containing protein [Rhodoplanes azumiensis]|uniref:DUF6456 domain-containing protein n=1 Tax=Rhodoplanes azumiensis TaxID=1897628 RepID=A0ABW5AGM5_9BRAD
MSPAAAAIDAGDLVGPFRAKRLRLARRPDPAAAAGSVLVDEAESPLAWLARRKGRDGRAMIEPVQLLAGERLRADFTFAQLGPRVTVDWSATLAPGASGGGGGPAAMTDAVLAARQRLAAALRASGSEFAGLLLDVCCFLKGLEEIERERGWPARSAKVVLQLGLDRLARHYGLAAAARGRPGAPMRAWRATVTDAADPDAADPGAADP